MPDPKVVHVEVHGQKYPIRTSLDPQYVEELAQFVEARMSLASKSSPSLNSHRLSATGLSAFSLLTTAFDCVFVPKPVFAFCSLSSLTRPTGKPKIQSPALLVMVTRLV